MHNGNESVTHRFNFNYYVKAADDYLETQYDLSIFDLPQGDFEKLQSCFDRGIDPTEAIRHIYNFQFALL